MSPAPNFWAPGFDAPGLRIKAGNGAPAVVHFQPGLIEFALLQREGATRLESAALWEFMGRGNGALDGVEFGHVLIDPRQRFE